MAARSAMRLFAATVAVLVLVSFTSAAIVNNTNNYRVTLTVKGTASDFLQVAKRNSFCAAFTGILQGTGLAQDLQSCVIDSAVNSATNGEVVVTAFFSFTAARSLATVVSTINTAYSGTGGSTEFPKPATGDVAAAAASQGTFPSYFAQVEAVVTPAIASDAVLNEVIASIKTAQPTITSLTCTRTTIQTTAATPTDAATKITCDLGSITATRTDLVSNFRSAATGSLSGTGGPYTATYVRDTGLLGAATGNSYTIAVTMFINDASSSTLQTGTDALKNALVTALTPLAVAANVALANQQTVTGGATVSVEIKVADEPSVNRALEILKTLIGQTLGVSPATFRIGGITSLTITPGLQSSALATAFPSTRYRFTIPIVNTSSAFTSAPFQLRRVCESITAPSNGNLSSCAIAEINRVTTASGDSGSFVIEVTAANNSAALSVTPNVVRNVAGVTGGFFLGTPVQTTLITDAFSTETLSLTLGAPYTSPDSVTQTVRNTICDQITSNAFVPMSASGQPPLITCSIQAGDITAATASTVTVLARVTYRIPDFSITTLAAALNRARQLNTLQRTPQDLNTVITAIAPGPAVATPATFVMDLEFNVNIAFASFNDANQQSFTNAVRTAAGNNAIAAFVSSSAATNLNPNNGTQVTVRVFTTSAAAQGDAYEAIAAQVAGTNLTFGTSPNIYTLQSPAGFRRVTFSPAVSASEFPSPPTPPATPAPVTPTAPVTPAPAVTPALQPQAPVVVPIDTGDQNSASRNIQFELAGTGDLAAANAFVQQVVNAVNAATPGSIISGSVIGGVTTVGKKFITQNYRFVANFVSSTPANAAQLNTRITNAVNSGSISSARVVNFSTSTTTPTPITPSAPGAPAAPAVPAAAAGTTSGNIDVTILGTKSGFTAADANALQTAVAATINGTALIINTEDTSTSRKFTMQASAVRVTMAVTAPAAQYPTVAAIANRVLTQSRVNGRLGNSSVVNVAVAGAGAAARSGPVALTLLVALLIAALSAMAQF